MTGEGAIRIVLSMGDPCGVGPELCLKAMRSPRLPADAALTVVGSLELLGEEARALGVRPALRAVPEAEQRAGGGAVIDMGRVDLPRPLPRSATAEGGRASLEYIERAVQETLGGRADALVTCPISKEAIGAAGSPYPGHTEMLGALTGCERPVMLLVSGGLRVAFATTHIALKDVPGALTAKGVAYTGSVLARALKEQFGIREPRVAVCALNPHAGDGGRFGDEEPRLLEGAVARLKAEGVDASGPHPADTLFARALAGRYDGVVALYHDQGMIAIKLSGVGGVVNVTLALPIIRTSPGHGTAYDIAGRGIADEASLMAAIELAAGMAGRRTQI